MGQDDHLEVEDWVLSDSTDGDTVASVSVPVESRLWSVWLLEDVDGLHWGGVALELVCVADVVSEALLDLLDGWGWSVLELQGDALGVAVGDGDSVALGGDLDLLRGEQLDVGLVLGDGAQNLLGLPLHLVLLAANVWDDVVEDVDAWDTWGETGTGDSLQGSGGQGVDWAKGVNQRLQWSHKTSGGAVGDADDETWSGLAGSLGGVQLASDNVQMLWVDDRNDQRHVDLSSVVLGVGNDGQTSLDELLLDWTGVLGI